MFRIRYSALLLGVAAPALMAQTATTISKPASFAGGNRNEGAFAATILEMGISPRAVGLAEAMGAIVGDPSSIWYNVAGLARYTSNSFLVTASQRFADTRLGGANVVFPTTIGTFTIGARALDAGTIEQVENYNVLGRCRAYQLGLEGGGAIQLIPHLMMGGTFFYQSESLCNQSAATVGMNLGFILNEFYTSRLNLGFGFRNWGTSVTFDSASAGLPFVFYAAGAYDLLRHTNLMQTPILFSGQTIALDLKAVGQLNFPNGVGWYPALALEGTVNGMVIGRLGYSWGSNNRSGITLGAGINVGQFRLEYGFRNRQNAGAGLFSYDPIGDDQSVSATLFFGGPQSNKPVVPVVISQPIDTAAINETVRNAVEAELTKLRPLLDSLRNARVEVRTEAPLVSQYIVPIHFEFDSANVSQEDMEKLKQVAEVIKHAYPKALVTIEGFTDPAGSREYNMRLSRKRAEAVKQIMVDEFHLPERQFRVAAYGAEASRQVAPGASRNDYGASQNRRVTFTIDATQHF